VQQIATTTAILAAFVVAASGCGASVVRTKPQDPVVNHAVTTMWARDIKRVAKDGDWILTRSYSAVGDVIALGTRGPEISHASIYDAERGTAIEAVRPVVHEVPLEELLERNRVAIIVRPHGLTDEQRRAALLRARSVLGRSFDVAGMFGMDNADKFYCSELLVWAARIETDSLVVTPASLVDYGEVIYLSGIRESPELQQVALEKQRRTSTQVASAKSPKFRAGR
jgi:hypothetical protein